MKRIREIIRMKSQLQMSDRQVARALNVSRPVVAKYWQAFQDSELSYERIAQMADSGLLGLLQAAPPPPKDSRYEQLAVHFPHFLVELQCTGVTLQLLWEEYKKTNPDGFQYTQFCCHYRKWRDSTEVKMHIKHKAGEKMFVDYAGKKLCYIERRTGKEKPVEVFVAVLGASGLTYVEGSESQKEQQWIRSNERALRYFGGVTKAIVPDNLRSAVSYSHRYEPDINPTFDDFAQHYGTVIIPARVRKARDKALVENAVRLVYQRIYAPLRNRIFYSLQELNEAVWDLLKEYNDRAFQRLKISRRQLFESSEKSALKPLPREPFPLKTTKWATIQYNHHVELREDLHYYSVPHYLYRKNPKRKVKLVYDERIVVIYYDNVRLVQYKRDRTPNGYTTLPEHMPEDHRRYSEWNPERFRRWARSIGPQVEVVIGKVLEGRKHPEQSYKTCMGILSLEKKYGAGKLNKACRRADRFGSYSCRRIEDMLKRGMEEDRQPELELVTPEHENIRGSQYYD